MTFFEYAQDKWLNVSQIRKVWREPDDNLKTPHGTLWIAVGDGYSAQLTDPEKQAELLRILREFAIKRPERPDLKVGPNMRRVLDEAGS